MDGDGGGNGRRWGRNCHFSPTSEFVISRELISEFVGFHYQSCNWEVASLRIEILDLHAAVDPLRG
jgi:hypothetical protein